MNPAALNAEELRHVALEILAAAHPAACRISAIQRKAKHAVMFEFKQEELASALDFLTDLKLITWEPDGLGATRFYKCTAAGLLAQERGTL